MAFMASASAAGLTDQQRAALDTLVRDLRAIFGSRLHSLVVYGLETPTGEDDYLRTLGLVEHLTFDDLTHACRSRLSGIAADSPSRCSFPRTSSRERSTSSRSSTGNIIARHIVIAGDNPFRETRVAEADRRRACEQQAKSHLIHLREGFLETEGDPRHVARLIARSAPAFRALLANIVQLEGGVDHRVDNDALASAVEPSVGIPAGLIVEVLSARADMNTVADPTALLARYIDAIERIWRYVDGWRA